MVGCCASSVKLGKWFKAILSMIYVWPAGFWYMDGWLSVILRKVASRSRVRGTVPSSVHSMLRIDGLVGIDQQSLDISARSED